MTAARSFGVAAILAGALIVPAPASALQQRVVADDGHAGELLGDSVAIDGDTAVAGAPFAAGTAGAVYVFARLGDTWMQTAKLTASDGSIGEHLGISVAIDGDTIVAGADNADTGKGAVYTFTRTGSATRQQSAKLVDPNGAVSDNLGASVAIDGNNIVAGAPRVDIAGHANQGAVFTFDRAGGVSRDRTAKLTASDAGTEAERLLGSSVAIDGDTIVAGAPGADVSAFTATGVAYTFDATGAALRASTATLSRPVADLIVAQGDHLGASVAITGETIAVGAPDARVGGPIDRSNLPGEVLTYSRTGASRTQAATLTVQGAATQDKVGASVAIDGDTIFAGANGVDVAGKADQGAVYTFGRTGTVTRNQTGRITEDAGAAGDNLGFRIGVAGTTLLASATGVKVGGNVLQGALTFFFNPAGQSGGGLAGGSVVRAPSISGFKLSPKSVKAGKKAKFKFKLVAAARVKIKLERKITRRRFKKSKTLSAAGKAGANVVTLKTKGLKTGSYRATVTATNSGGKRTAKAGFRIRH